VRRERKFLEGGIINNQNEVCRRCFELKRNVLFDCGHAPICDVCFEDEFKMKLECIICNKPSKNAYVLRYTEDEDKMRAEGKIVPE
jgi:hypothetical protein